VYIPLSAAVAPPSK